MRAAPHLAAMCSAVVSAAVAGAAVLATTLAFVAFGRTAMSDMLLAFFTTSAVALGVLR